MFITHMSRTKNEVLSDTNPKAMPNFRTYKTVRGTNAISA